SLPPLAVSKVRWLVTSGSPLRKYADLFYWGTDVGSIARVDGWTNFWDRADPVADPLGPLRWDPGRDQTPAAEGPSLFHSFDADSAQDTPYAVDDLPVDNVQN